MKLRWIDETLIEYWCPGCGREHTINLDLDLKAQGVPTWTLTGPDDTFTLHPSVNYVVRRRPEDPPRHVCHHWVRDGRIEFLGDCTHALKGQTVDVPAWPK